MGKRSKYTPEQIGDAVDRLAKGAGRRELMSETGISERDANRFVRIAGMTAAEFNKKLADKIEEVAAKGIELIERDLELIPPGQRALTLGILLTKRAELSGISPTPTNQVNVQINGLTRDAVIGELVGAATKQPKQVVPTLEAELVPKQPLPHVTDVGENSPLSPAPTPADPATEANPSGIP